MQEEVVGTEGTGWEFYSIIRLLNNDDIVEDNVDVDDDNNNSASFSSLSSLVQ